MFAARRVSRLHRRGRAGHRCERRHGGGTKKFAEKYDLPFTLLADSDGTVAKAFGVPAIMGMAKRQSFIVVDGKIAGVIESAKTGDHATEVQAALAKLELNKKS